MDPGYCSTATNAVIDTAGRLAARYGATALTTTPITSSGTFTTPPNGGLSGATSATLSANFTQGVTGQYWMTFADGETRLVTLTNGANTVTWSNPLTAAVGLAYTITYSVQSAWEYIGAAGAAQGIIAWAGGISNNLVSPTNNLGGTGGGAINVTNGRWFFQNFNNKCVGFQAGQTPIVYTGSGTFAYIAASAGSAPTGGIGCAAFGRLWSVGSDLQTIQYSGLLDETDWSTTDGNAGVIDMHTIWADGTDTVTAIFAFNASLVVCGLRHIVFFTDGRGSMLGMDPTQAYVFDVLLGTGCVSQWTVDHIGESDVVFLSPNGLQSLQRLTQNRNNPLETLSKYNRDTILTQLQSEVATNISGCFNQTTGFYVLGFPVNGITWCFDMRRLYTDQVGALCSITTQWTMALTACHSDANQNNLYLCRVNQGTICQYSNYLDESATYSFIYLSPWMTLGQEVAQRLKLVKRITITMYTAGNVPFTITWGVDFGNTSGNTTYTLTPLGANSQYGIGQYGLAQYGGTGSNLYIYKYPAHIKGQYHQLGFQITINGQFALQQAQYTAKIGRIA